MILGKLQEPEDPDILGVDRIHHAQSSVVRPTGARPILVEGAVTVSKGGWSAVRDP